MDKAIRWYQSALITRLKFKEEIPNLVALAQTNLGIAYTLVHDYHSANQLLKDALEVRRRLKKEKPEDFAEKVSISAYSLASYYISQSACVNGLRFDKVLLEKSWAEEIAALLAESWETFDQKDCTPQKMSANQQNVLFNHRMIEAVYLFTLGKLSETARECATRTAAVKQLGFKTGQEDLYIAAFYLFSQAESLIEELKKDESENLKFNKISCGDRRYGIFSVNAVLGKLLVSDALKDDSKDILAEYHTIISYVSNLNQDASLAAEQTLIAVIAFYGEFIMLHPDLADQQKLKALMRKAKKLIDKLSKYGEKTVKALEPALKSIQHTDVIFAARRSRTFLVPVRIERQLLVTGNRSILCNLLAALRCSKPAKECAVAPFSRREPVAELILLCQDRLILCDTAYPAGIRRLCGKPDRFAFSGIEPDIMQRYILRHIINRMVLFQRQLSVSVHALIAVLCQEPVRNPGGILRLFQGFVIRIGRIQTAEQQTVSFIGGTQIPLIQQNLHMIRCNLICFHRDCFLPGILVFVLACPIIISRCRRSSLAVSNRFRCISGRRSLCRTDAPYSRCFRKQHRTRNAACQNLCFHTIILSSDVCSELFAAVQKPFSRKACSAAMQRQQSAFMKAAASGFTKQKGTLSPFRAVCTAV
ncbi:MAG: tetratricopeptide repeat protein [Oscillospiraceae bacterium]|nr:tetratricopeptide repeat protein [Oscillospiraceae bacterium]